MSSSTFGYYSRPTTTRVLTTPVKESTLKLRPFSVCLFVLRFPVETGPRTRTLHPSPLSRVDSGFCSPPNLCKIWRSGGLGRI